MTTLYKALAGAVGLVVALTTAVAMAQAPTGVPDPKQAIAQARVAFKQQDYDAAITILQAAHAVQPRAVYVFSIGRSYEEKGWLQEAYDHFVLYPSQPRTVPELLEEAAVRAASLAPLLHRGVADLRPIPESTRVAVDGQIVPHEALPLTPGSHTVCLFPDGSARAACWTRDLAPARRVALPPATDGPRGRVALPLGAAVSIDGVALPGAADVTEVELDTGTYLFELTLPGALSRTVRVEVAVGAVATLDVRPPPLEVRAPPLDVRAPPPPEDPWPWALVGVGSASAAAGLGLLIAALVDRSALTSPEREAGVITSFTQADAQRRWEQVDTFVLSGSVLAGAGAALVVGGLTWRALDGEEEEGDAGGVLWIGPTSPTALGVGGSF